MKIFLVFKTHFDIGFTKLSREVIGQYAGSMLSEVIETCEGTADMGKLRYVWTMPAWPLTVMQENEEKRASLDRLIRDGQIAFHALPFTSHFDFGSLEDAADGLKYAVRLSKEYGLPLPVSAKMTDVPGHGRALPMLLANAGVKFLHLGCNEFQTPPAVPRLFFWEGPDGGRVLTMYSKGGYGSALRPPEDWPYPVWMALMHTHDNCGPQSAEMIRRLADEARAICPDAEIVCGTMDDFYHALAACDLSDVPVVTGDLADSWIHGAGSYPAEVGQVRQARRDLTAAGAAVFAAGGDAQALAAARDRAGDALALFDEHTWGLDVKIGLKPDRVYEKNAFRAAKDSAEYRRMEASWQEQTERAQTAADAAAEALACAGAGEDAVLNPNGASFTGWADADGLPGALCLAGRERVFVRDVPALAAVKPETKTYPAPENVLENHRYRLTLDRVRGVITELYDKKLSRVLARERDGVGVFAYQYDVYGIDDLTEYLRSVAYRFSDWGVRDYGRDNYPDCPHRTFRPVCTGIETAGYTLTLRYCSEAAAAYGDAREIRVSVALPPEGDELFVRVALDGKEETPYIESGSLALPLAADAPRYRFNKNGDLIDPAHDIVSCANHALYCLEAFACAEDEAGGLAVVTRDAPLCAIGETGIHKFRREYEERTPILYFNLYNNMWGTNFPQWIGGDLHWDFTLFGYAGVCGGAVYARALALDQGARVLPVGAAQAGLTLPDGVQVMALCPTEAGWRLRLRDTALTARTGTLQAPGRRIRPVDLRGSAAGTPAEGEMSFPIAPFGIYSFILEAL